MSHLVLARKYRPRSFDQMVGQAHVVQALSNALTSGRLHHAYLFTGTRGIGKTTVSRILAKSLNCTGPDGAGGITAHPCGVCQACTEIDADRYIDYMELDAASNRSIDEIRDLIERAAYKPSVGRFKVFMIDEAHQLTKDAFNALLKTLEEPPDYLKFVLATVQALRELGLSAAGTLEEMAALLQQMAVEQAVPGALDESDPDTGNARALAAELPPDETQLLYSIVVHGRAELSLLSDEYAALTMVLLRLLAFAPAGGVPVVASAARAVPLVAAAREARSSAPARPVAALPLPLVQAPAVTTSAEQSTTAPAPVSVINAAAAPSAAPVARVANAAAAQLGPAVNLDRPAHALNAEEQPPPWVDDSLPDDDSLSGVGVPGSGDEQAEPTRVDAAVVKATFSAPAPAPRQVTQRPALSALVPSALGEQWMALIRPLIAAGSVVAMARELALQAGLQAVQPVPSAEGGGRRWQLCVERETLRAPALAAKLAAALSEALGEPVQLVVQAGVPQDSIARRDTLAREGAQRDAEQTIQNDPAVQALLAQFRTARIVPGSIKALSPNPNEPRTPSP